MTSRFISALGLASAFIALCACSLMASQATQDPTAIKMVAIRGGSFTMGKESDEGQQGGPPHRVTITQFELGETDITFNQYDAFARATSRPLPQDEGRGRGDFPVVNVSWLDMQDYIAWLNRRTKRHYRLPTEAEWEYAARAGTTTDYFWGDQLDPTMANSAGSIFNGPSPVKSFPANPFGLYDMSGNVWQAVADCVHPDYVGAPAEGSAWAEPHCTAHIARGGYYGSLRFGLTVVARSGIGESFRSMGLGFRLAEDADPKKK
jgi:formylglycine-generating enzyme required for sulfatase activity